MYEIKAIVRGHATHTADTTRLELFDTDRQLELSIIVPTKDAENWPDGSGLVITLGAGSKIKKQ